MKIDKKALDGLILKEIYGIKSPGQAISDSVTTQISKPTTLTPSTDEKKKYTTEVENSSVDRIRSERDKILDYIDNLKIEDLQKFKSDVRGLLDLLGFVDKKRI